MSVEWLYILAAIGVFWGLKDVYTPKTDYFHGRSKAWYKAPEPFIEYDADGFLTEESYRSHIFVTTYGPGKGMSFGVDPKALVQTRKFKEQCDATKRLFERQKGLNKDK